MMPLTPPVNREGGDLAPIFRVPFLAWLAVVEERVPHHRNQVRDRPAAVAVRSWPQGSTHDALR